LACSSAICFFSSSFSSRALAAMAFHRLELVAAGNVHAVQDLGDLVADAGLDLVLHAGQRAHGAVGHLGEVVDEGIAGLHDCDS
jgi:hypothetical protein